MRIKNDSDQSVNFRDSGPRAPWFWFDDRTLDGAALPWIDVAPGSIYIKTTPTNAAMYLKVASLGATSDWEAFVRADSLFGIVNGLSPTALTIVGDLTVTGTVTAGDVTVDPLINAIVVSRGA